MKVLGLSFGRKGKNCDILTKEALFGAQEKGAEIFFINLMDKKITHCTGCGACDKRRASGGPSRCIIKDDFPFIEDAMLDADAIIISAPVYVLAPLGQYKNLVDRLGPSHDRSVMETVNQQRIDAGKSGEELLDPRLFKDRFLGLISVGGATTEHWTSMGLPSMHLISFSMQMTVVDHINAYALGNVVNPVLDDRLIDRVHNLGINVAGSLGNKREDAGWFGDEPGICPHCHNKLLTILSGTDVECPLCGMAGTLVIENGQIKAVFTPEQEERSRQRFGGVEDHRIELANIGRHVQEVLAKDGARLPGLLEKYERIKEVDKSKFVENLKQ